MWFGLERIIEALVFLGTSILVARSLGAEKLGYLMFLNFVLGVANQVSGLGLAAATKKYMAEYFGKGRPEVAAAVYRYTLRLQVLLAAFIATGGCAITFSLGNPAYRGAAYILSVAAIPALLTWIPSQANTASEDFSRNVPSSVIATAVYALVIVLAVIFRLGLAGVASATLASRSVELVVRIFPVYKRLASFPAAPIPQELKRQIRRFCTQTLGLTVLALVVWDRSEVLFLKAFCDLRQLAYYSVGFSLAQRMLILPFVFGGATSASLMVESARDETRIDSIFRNAITYLAFFALPAYLGMAAIAGPLIRLAYGDLYVAAVPVLIISVLLATIRGVQPLAEALFQAIDRQDVVLRWMFVVGIVNIALDAALIPHFQAIGAALGNGIAQVLGVLGLWVAVVRLLHLHTPLIKLGRIAFSALVMMTAVIAATHSLQPFYAICTAIPLGLLIYSFLLRATAAVDPDDARRIQQLTAILPQSLRRRADALLSWIGNCNKLRQAANQA